MEIPADSIGYAVMQFTKRAALVQAEKGWNDNGIRYVGWQHPMRTKAACATMSWSSTPPAAICESTNLLMVIGLDNLVVNTQDALLVMTKGQAQDAAKIVDTLQRKGHDNRR